VHTPEPAVVVTPIPHAPQVIASFAAPPVAFQVVSEHESVAEEPHRPVRKPRHEGASGATGEPLQLVETAREKVVPPAALEEEVVRPPVRRRRRHGMPAAAEPLELVETRPGAAQPPSGDA
jgi:hypothetical protein